MNAEELSNKSVRQLNIGAKLEIPSFQVIVDNLTEKETPILVYSGTMGNTGMKSTAIVFSNENLHAARSYKDNEYQFSIPIKRLKKAKSITRISGFYVDIFDLDDEIVFACYFSKKIQTQFEKEVNELISSNITISNEESNVDVSAFCTNCGSKRNESQRFCGSCGEKFEEITLVEKRKEDNLQHQFIQPVPSPVAKPLSKKEQIKENKKNGIVCCPKCGSTSLSANKKGFGVGKALVGSTLTLGVGLLAGAAGSRKIIITCLNCGKKFKPGK